MKALIGKDFRLGKGVLLVGVVLLIGPYAVACLDKLIAKDDPHSNISWAQTLGNASRNALCLGWVTAACLGGSAIACDMHENSDQFLAYLPPKRRTMIGSKLLVFALPAVCEWLINLLIFFVAYGCYGFRSQAAGITDNTWAILAATIAAGILAFGASWFFSCFAERPLHAALLGLASMAVAWVVISTLQGMGTFTRSISLILYAGIAASTGLFGVAAGTVIFLRQPRLRR